MGDHNYPTKDEWEKYKEKIIALYVDANMKVGDVITYMRDKYDHNAT